MKKLIALFVSIIFLIIGCKHFPPVSQEKYKYDLGDAYADAHDWKMKYFKIKRDLKLEQDMNKQLVERLDIEMNRLDKAVEIIKRNKDNINSAAKDASELIRKLSNQKKQILAQRKIIQAQSKKIKEQEALLNRIQAQAKDLENSLREEIKSGQVKIQMYKNKLIVNVNNKILFESGKAELRSNIVSVLDKIKVNLNKFKDNNIIIEGHTDTDRVLESCKYKDNWELSTARSLSVLWYILKNKQLNPKRFSVAGYSKYRPVATNKTDKGKSLNRRVDIVITPH